MTRNFRRLCVTLFAVGAAIACVASPVQAQFTSWTGLGGDDDFFNDANWDNTAPDTPGEYGLIDSSDVNQVAVIGAATGTVTMLGINLGEFSGGGNVIQNGGTIIFDPSDSLVLAKIGGDGPNPSSWVMNNDAVLLYDGPIIGGGGYGFDGTIGADFDVGNGASIATFELHDTAILRIADDMKISDNGTAAGSFVSLDGSSQITVGSGTSIGSNGPASLTIAENALYVSGNSAGPGNSGSGYTNEGYLTAHQSEILVKDSGRLWIRTLQQRGGETNITIQDNARFDIFDVFFNAAPDLGNATVQGSVGGSERTSHISQGASDITTITIKNNGVMTVDSDIPDSFWSGLAIAGGTNSGGDSAGGEATIDVQDNGTFIVEQDLNMTLGFDANAKSTLKVRGPNATVSINGDLRMALDSFGVENPGSAILNPVITADSQATINVGGNINIDNGELLVELDGYSPLGGESYEIVSAGSITGASFKSEDFSLAVLPGSLSWEVDIVGTSIFLNVLGFAADYDDDGDVDGDDFLVWQAGFGNNDSGDADGDGDTDGDDFLIWQSQFGSSSGSGSGAVPEPSAVVLSLLAMLGVACQRIRRR